MSKTRLFSVLAVVMVAFLLVSMVSPMTATARPAKVVQPFSTGTAVAPDYFAVNTVGLQAYTAPVRIREPKGAVEVDPNYGVIQETLGSLQIPRTIVNRPDSFHGGPKPWEQNRAGMIGPDKRYFEDPAPSYDAWWNGLNQGSNRTVFGAGVLPPDTNGAASSDYYVQTINGTIAIWDLGGLTNWGAFPKTIYGPAPISTLWNGSGDAICENNDDGDPIVLFDEGLQVWLVSQFALPNYPAAPFYQCIAVSQTDNPMGAWNLYRYSFNVMNDYPHFGVWQDGYYMSINQFSGGSWAGQGVAVFERAVMSSATPATAATARMIYINTFNDCTSAEAQCYLGGMLPSDTDGVAAPASTPNFFMQFDDDAWGYSPDQLQIWKFETNWGAGTATFTHLADLPVNSFDSEVCTGYSRNCIPQPGTTRKLDAIADRLMYRIQFRNFAVDTPAVGEPAHFTLVTNHTVDVNQDPTNVNYHAGVRWYELRSTDGGATWGVYQQGDLAPNAQHRWMASAAMDAMGDIAVGYSVSSSSLYPTIAWSARQYTDPLNTLPRTEYVLLPPATAAGAQTNAASRWGDYSMMDVADNCQFFFTSEYLRGTTSAEWYTAVGAFSFDSCWNSDVTPPTGTTIDGFPTDPSNSTTAGFTFSNPNTAGDLDSFECSMDGGSWATCTSPKTYTGLSLGSHTFEVRAQDTNGNFETTPASYTWTVEDTTAPDTTIDTFPTTPNITASFTFSGNDGATGSGIDYFECQYTITTPGGTASSGWNTCTSPYEVPYITNGSYLFEVRAYDMAGNVDPTPASQTWNNSGLMWMVFRGGSSDGWIRELTETSGTGSLYNTGSGTLNVGDDQLNRQYLSILSFNTSKLPDTANVVGGYLALRQAGTSNPFPLHGDLVADIANPFFGTKSGVGVDDFNALANANAVATFGSTPDGFKWYYADLTTPAYTLIGKTTVNPLTQFRLRFTIDDDNDLATDLIKFYSGNAFTAANRPVLVIYYYVP